MTNHIDTQVELPEAFQTVKEASKILNIPLWKLYRAVHDNLLPHYRFYNSRVLVKLSDIEKAIEQSRQNERSNVVPLQIKSLQ